MRICEQNPQLDPKVRFMIMQEADAVVADLEEVLSAVWLRAPTPAQQAFLEAGGPERDRKGLDPDGDGYACAWDPTPFRAAVQQ